MKYSFKFIISVVMLIALFVCSGWSGAATTIAKAGGKQVGKQIAKQGGKQIAEQAAKQASKQAAQQAASQAAKQTSKVVAERVGAATAKAEVKNIAINQAEKIVATNTVKSMGSSVVKASIPTTIAKASTSTGSVLVRNIPGKSFFYHGATGVRMIEKEVLLDGSWTVKPFPVFNSVTKINLPENLLKSSRAEHFRYCSSELAKKIENNSALRNKFTQEQITQIMNKSPKITNLTWHHNEATGVMELVDEANHQAIYHVGGYRIWGAGAA